MDSYTFNLLAKTDTVKNRYLTTNGLSPGYLTDNEVKAIVESTSGLRVAVYDKQYKGRERRFPQLCPLTDMCA